MFSAFARNAVLGGTALALIVGAATPLHAQLSDAINDAILGGRSPRAPDSPPTVDLPATPVAPPPAAAPAPPAPEAPDPAAQTTPALDTAPDPSAAAAPAPTPAADTGGTSDSDTTSPTPVALPAQPQNAAGSGDLSTGDEPSLEPGIRVSQEQISSGAVNFRQVQEIGRHLFTQSFTTADGYGEGPEGPREKKRHQSTSGISPMAAYVHLPWMRVDGLDSQACLECHNASGFEVSGSQTAARSVRPDRVSGAGPIASAAIINPLLEDPAPQWVLEAFRARGISDPSNLYAVFLRNPPHVFGAGYTQKLAEEMTFDLLSQRLSAVRQADAQRGQAFEIQLNSKGSDFGSYAVRIDANAPPVPARLQPCGSNPGITERCSTIDGVSEDLVIRPFQWKGIASNMRNFVRDALNFHLGMMPVELAPDEADADGDGVPNEVSYGEVTALTAFALGNRPPEEMAPATAELQAQVARGRALFEGTDTAGAGPNCAACHQPTKTILNPVVTVHDPRTPEVAAIASRESSNGNHGMIVAGNGVGLGQATPPELPLPVEREFSEGGGTPARERAILNESARAESAGRTFPKGAAFAFNLNMDTPFESQALLASEPRLPFDTTGAIAVSLFSDLKRHAMGRCLADIIPQQTDRKGVFVRRDLYLTRPLWGVSDTGPWLHDGRALSLKDAILQHSDDACADDGSGHVSEANGAVAAFRALSPADQDALVAFLHTLRLPRDKTYASVDPKL
ncbi:di-heme oxidoredictase family protein [Aurantimonas sp. VKM B-3413]|uniref:c-type cytochrome n=1 Tax=Aurantimonas sp. VKM B-3413 TaxID=2779401 RepID=UPI001E643652|nr:di-heme oxidoredictase family protein [Aurantimonas sp. VKM B-3413]MCB8837749.1 hypothetical protein [Aurantimonas sp. VKM B-3413]